MYGSTELFNALNVSAVTSSLSTFDSKPALFSSNILPEQGISSPESTINFYMTTPFNGGLENENYVYTIDCRSTTYKNSRTIADNVLTAINRESYTDYYLVCDLLPTIPPADSTDNYNTPVQVTIKIRS